MKTYILKPNMTLKSVTILPDSDKPAVGLHPNTPEERALRQLVNVIAPPPVSPKAIVIAVTPGARTLPPRQPLPTPVLYAGKPSLKLGLDVRLELIMAVVQRDHAAPQAPRKFTPDQLILQVQKWVAEGWVVYAVAESCGFG